MSLQLYMGSAGTGKSYQAYTRIIEESKKHPEFNYLVIVPEQFTMQTQKELVSLHPDKGILNIDVLSFERLAYRVFEEVGGGVAPLLEETGKSLVLQRVVQEKQKELTVLGSNLQRTGSIAQMKSLLSELMQYQVDDALLEEWILDARDKPLLACKLQDVRKIYQGFTEFLQGKYITGEEVLDVLCERIEQSEKLKNSVVLLDGFTGFTPIQNQVAGQLLRLCRKVMVTVTIDNREDAYAYDGPHRLFSMSKKMIHKLLELCRQFQVEIEEPCHFTHSPNSRYAGTEALQFLEENLFRYHAKTFTGEQDQIQMWVCENPTKEMEVTAQTIHRLVRMEGYRYKDFAVVTGDLPTYGHGARQLFARYGIPCFIDEKHSVLLNPFVEFVRASVDLGAQRFSYDAMFRFLRCGLTSLQPEEIDELENYVIALGIRGWKQYNQPWIRTYHGMDPDRILVVNAMRQTLAEELQEFAQGFSGRNLTVSARTKVLYDFICKNEIQKKLKVMEERFEREGATALSREYAQIYGIVMGLLDKLGEVLGEEQMSARHYQEILEAGLLEAQVGVIPPSADQVLIGDIERTRLKAVKVLFFVGINDGIIPKPVNKAGILSELDREFLSGKAEADQLAPTARIEMYMQRFYLYLSMTKPSEKLYLSYSKASSQGTALLPAYLITLVGKQFPKLAVRDWEQEKDPLLRIETAEGTLELMIGKLREIVDGTMPEEEALWKELYRWYRKDSRFSAQLLRLVEAAYYHNPKDVISAAVAKALYGNELVNSATRLEQFAACAFAHFLKYGLQLSQRQTYEFTGADMGNIMHEALEHFSNKMNEKGLKWRDLEEDVREELIDECVEELVHDYGNTILHSSSRNAYLIARVKRILRRTVWALQNQVQAGAFEPGGFEVSFAMEERLDAVNFDLSPDVKLKLRGRIDRVDLCEKDDKVYVKIIDYKSGNTSLDLVELYHGLQLQLVVYMNAAMEWQQKKQPDKTVEPAGIFYYKINDPLVTREKQESREVLEQKLLGTLKPDGLVRAEPEVVELMDSTLGAGISSSVIPVGYTKSGALSSYSHVAAEEDFTTLSSFVNHKIKELGGEILRGNAEVSPYQTEKKDACGFCPYHGICSFDERVDGYEFRKLKKEDQEVILEKMRREV
ncbi:MAG: helicase-exonuclease AddAB subunit AddB [Lachnospiraceae bacterium]|nr:helicase-exonuclease AddAB subunit AddB [Lachnospiraceae bacterium]